MIVLDIIVGIPPLNDKTKKTSSENLPQRVEDKLHPEKHPRLWKWILEVWKLIK
jgi:hypothetical protein